MPRLYPSRVGLALFALWQKPAYGNEIRYLAIRRPDDHDFDGVIAVREQQARVGRAICLVKRWPLAAQLASTGRKARCGEDCEFHLGQRFAVCTEFADTIDLHSEKLCDRT
ncbi:hypothetical protein [Devosia insulae]|uniref:hypothetical protein n=1 Tax=Devosia insulae TaxID=408174 RepID=UPI00114C9568|nr:hypothetical protein [Devosia insulae]